MRPFERVTPYTVLMSAQGHRFRVKPAGGSSLPELGEGWVRVLARTAVEPEMTVWVRPAAKPNGRLYIAGLLLGEKGDREVSARTLRRISLAGLLELLENMAVLGLGSLYKYNSATLRSLKGGPRISRSFPGSKGLPDAHFSAVAEGYRAAMVDAPRRPVEHLAETWGRPVATVRRWVGECRARGLLGPAKQGAAGEQPAPPKKRRTTK